ncbi:MAG: hypothetical protein K8M05_03830, partial [Deltaproteobacteria bacterium]|nr:hypothetical protein [Kofleriaceae bacterium]
MGAVYRAHDRLTGQDVAVKRLVARKPPPDPTLPMTRPPIGSEPTVLADVLDDEGEERPGHGCRPGFAEAGGA